MNNLPTEQIVVVLKQNARFRWFRSDRELWVLDRNKWQKSLMNPNFVSDKRKWQRACKNAGYEGPASDPAARFGIQVVNEHTIDRFLEEMRELEVEKGQLATELLSRFPTAQSSWDVVDLFPIMFVDCDRKHVAAFYPGGTRMERYVPNGWTRAFEDFATEYAEDIFPNSEKFWIQGNRNMLDELNRRGEQATE